MRKLLHCIFSGKQEVSGIEYQFEIPRYGKERVNPFGVVAEGSAVVIIFHHNGISLGGYPGCEGRDPLTLGVFVCLGEIRRDEARNQEQAVKPLLIHESQGCILQLFLLAFGVINVGNGAGVLEAEAVQDPDFFGPLENPDIGALAAGLFEGSRRFSKGYALLADDGFNVVAEDGNLREFLFGTVAGDRSHCKGRQNS